MNHYRTPVLFSAVYVLVFLISILFSACAHPIPEFRPSQSMAKVRTVKEGIQICDEYHIQESNTELARLGVIIPWSRCIEDLLRTHQPAQEIESLAMLFHSLSKVENEHRDFSKKVVYVVEMNLAIHLAFQLSICEASNINSKSICFRELVKHTSSNSLSKVLPDYYEYIRSSARE